MQEGSIVEVNYTGKVVLSNEVFDTTVEKKAVDAGIFNERAKYRPVAVIVGESELLKGLDEALKGMNVGEEKKVVLKPADAFGERNPKLIAVLPLREFKRQKMQPVPGLVVEVNGRQGKVQSVSGGRVRVDFNHPLAGKELEYELRVEKELKGAKEQVQALFEKYFGMIPENERKISIKENVVEAALDARYTAAVGALKKRFSELVAGHVKGVETVRFVEEFKEKEAKKGKGKKP
jgi:FKBP-type peptidyl-prolyl cis-trans isomerase 2